MELIEYINEQYGMFAIMIPIWIIIAGFTFVSMGPFWRKMSIIGIISALFGSLFGYTFSIFQMPNEDPIYGALVFGVLFSIMAIYCLYDEVKNEGK